MNTYQDAINERTAEVGRLERRIKELRAEVKFLESAAKVAGEKVVPIQFPEVPLMAGWVSPREFSNRRGRGGPVSIVDGTIRVLQEQREGDGMHVDDLVMRLPSILQRKVGKQTVSAELSREAQREGGRIERVPEKPNTFRLRIEGAEGGEL